MSTQADLPYKRLFQAMPGKVLVVRPRSFDIVAVTAEYLKATMTQESDILGKTLFDVFPDDPQEPGAEGVKSLFASLERVQSQKITDVIGVLRYPVRRPDGEFEERYWSPVNSPVLDESGNIEFIMHRVEDVTSIVKGDHEVPSLDAPSYYDPVALQDVILRSRELRQTLSKLQEYEARMRTAERLLNLGAWEFNVQTGQLSWSEQVFDIYDVPDRDTNPNFDDYFAKVHPDDRAASLAVYQAFAEQGKSHLEFEHRVIARDGTVRHVKGVGERHRSSDQEVVVGYVQDISSLVSTRDKLSQAEHLLRLAGDKARLGGWRVDLASGASTWTRETALIHGMPADYSPPSVDDAILFYAPEFRAIIQEAFSVCATQGTDFDVICRLQTPAGSSPWVRAIGEAQRDSDGNIVAVQGAFQDISALHEAQVQAEEAKQERLNVLESISDAFFALDKNWTFTFANQQSGIVLERNRDELLGKNVWEEFPDAVGSEFERQYVKAAHHQETVSFKAYYPPLGKWFDVTAYPIPTGLAVYFRDVTLELERQEQLRLIDAALSRQNDIVMITEASDLNAPNGPRIVYVNDAFERHTGYSKYEAIGQTPRLLQGPDSDREQLDRIRKALENHEPIRCEVLNYTKAGASYWLELDITPLFDETGLCTHFVAVERDITVRMQKDAELRQAQERFELISKATNDVIWDWNFVADTVWWNDSITDVFGYQLSDLEPGPESWTSRIHPDDHDRVVESIHRAIESQSEFWNDEYRFIKSDGESAYVVDRGFIVRDDSGVAIRMLGSMHDATERMAMEQRLRESQKLETVGHLTGGVAHDFNNLLTVILGNTEMLSELITDEQLRPLAEMAFTASQRGAELTSRLLAFARRQPLDPKPTDLNHLVDAMRPLIRRTLPENIELEFMPDPNLGIAEIDASELDTALLNLVINARDAMPDGGRLIVETTNAVLDSHYAAQHLDVTPGEYVMICVTDTGTGMVNDTLQRAVEPFFTTKMVGNGSGLGLSMVFGFTKQSGGHIKLYSEPNEGTSVKLYFPRIQGGQYSSYQLSINQEPQGGSEHILIAEDDPLVLQHLAGQLRSLGYRVTAVGSGPEALEALQVHGDVDLLLTDIIMPGGMNGRELADQVCKAYPGVKILYTSGYTENAIVHRGRLDPGVELLSKPYTRLELAGKVRRVLEGLIH